jgi:2-keto-4-pentenoate hydratase/2-oxohepta-3-ene-1,7-dioic acid hydratase in catechol pathway
VHFIDKPPIPIGKIICLARTYRKHAEEMGSEVKKDPLLFLKPPSSVIYNQDIIVLPRQSHDVHHEAELGIIIEKQGKSLRAAQVADHIAGYCLGLDITARDIQQTAKEHGWPWTIAKGFDTFCPLSEAVSPSAVPNPHALTITLAVNGEIRQRASTSALIMTVGEIVAYVSSLMTLERGDIILTGTPEGVGQITAGDIIEAQLGDLLSLTVTVANDEK